MQGCILRRTNDLAVWKLANSAVLVMDLLILGSMWERRDPPHNLAEGMTARDWSNAFGAGIFAVVRLAFILEIGFKKGSGKKNT